MEIIFLIISIIITIVLIYCLDMLILDSYKKIINAYKTSEELLLIHIMSGIFMSMPIFILLCALNNTAWHLPYLFR